MKAIVPPETPGITFAAPIATPFRKSPAAFFTNLRKLNDRETYRPVNPVVSFLVG